MFSRILVKLIDEAILPAILLVVVRVLSAVLIAEQFSIPFELKGANFVYTTKADFLFVNSYSTLITVLFVALGLFYILVKSHLFHDSHVSPGLTAKLFSLRLSSFIQTSFDLYSQGAIWLSYSFLLLVATGIMYYFGLVFPWVFFVSLGVSLASTYLFVVDVEKEMLLGKKTRATISEEVVLTFGEDDL